MNFIPLRNYVLRIGIGHSKNKLNAFDRALVAAGIANYNLVKVSSILPPNCILQKEISQKEGQILHSAYAVIYSEKMGEVISSAVAIGISNSNDRIGVIMEHSAVSPQKNTEELVRSYAQQAMKDRTLSIKDIISISVECVVEKPEIYCSFATVSMW